MSEELRRDPVDGKVYSFAELTAYYSTQEYGKKAVKAYWNDECEPVKTKAKGKAEKQTKPEQQKKEKKPEEKQENDRDFKKEKSSLKEEKKEEKKLVSSQLKKLKDDEEKKEKKEKKEAKPQEAKARYMEVGGLCVCGEALIDFVPCLTSEGNGAFRPAYGGSPMNCCIAAQRMGVPVTFLGGLSTDMFGEQLHEHLKSEGVDVSLCPRLPNPTTLAFVSRGEGGEKYAFFKENSADRSLTKAHVVSALEKRRFKAVHMSLGAVTLEHKQCTEAFQTLFSMARKQGALRSFDPNIRANMITETGEKYSKRVEKLLKSVDLVKCSDDDAQFMYGKEVDIADLAAKWIKLGPKLVVFTLGAEGAAAFVPGESGLIRKDMKLPQMVGGSKRTIDKDGKATDVSDTVGAGDTFMGALITGCLGTSNSTLVPQLVEKAAWTDREVDLAEDVLRLAVTAAAMNCSCFGCDPPSLAQARKIWWQVPLST